LKSPAPIIAKFLGKEKQQPQPQQQQHHAPMVDIKGKRPALVNARNRSSSALSVEKLRATNVAMAVSDEAPDFQSEEMMRVGELAKRQFELKYQVNFPLY
jgi:hypothetical protein